MSRVSIFKFKLLFTKRNPQTNYPPIHAYDIIELQLMRNRDIEKKTQFQKSSSNELHQTTHSLQFISTKQVHQDTRHYCVSPDIITEGRTGHFMMMQTL